MVSPEGRCKLQQIESNMQKYENYRQQLGRLNKSLKEQFYLEAIFIEYAIMEDRLESVLRHSGRWNPDKPMSIYKKCSCVLKLAEEKKGIARRYFSEKLITSVLDWKENRNQLIHALLKQSLQIEELEHIAKEGRIIVKTLCGKVTSYNRMVDKMSK